MKSTSILKSFSLILLSLSLFAKGSAQDECRRYIPQPSLFHLTYWENSKRPASECETEYAKTCYDSLLSAYQNIFNLDNTWMRLSQPDTQLSFYALRIPEDLNDDMEIQVEDYYKVTPESERTLFMSVPDVSFNYRKDDQSPEFDKINKVRMQQRTKLGQVMQKAKDANAGVSKEMEGILLEMAKTDADFWSNNAFEIHTYINKAFPYDSDLKLHYDGSASFSYLPDSTLVIHTVKSKDIAPSMLVEGRLVPEDLIDEWYILLGNWTSPVIEQVGDSVSVSSSRETVDWKGLQPDMLTTHFITIKIKAGEKLKNEIVDLIDWKALKGLLY